VIAAIAGAFGVGLLVAGDDDGDQASSSETTSTTGDDETAAGDEGEDGTTTTTSAPASTAVDDELAIDTTLTGPAAEFDAALANAAALTYHVRYEGTAVGEDGSTTEYSIEVFRRSPDFRRDTDISRPEGTLKVREFLVGGTETVCFDAENSGTFTCQPPPAGQPISPNLVLFGVIDPAQGTVTADGTCFHIAVDETTAQDVCFNEDGVPTLIDDGVLRLEATLVELAVDDDALVPPA
jgi:hypothetical protein